MRDVLFVVGFIAFWIALNRWILPWFGVQTCMSGACARVPQDKRIKGPDTADTSLRDTAFKSP